MVIMVGEKPSNMQLSFFGHYVSHTDTLFKESESELFVVYLLLAEEEKKAIGQDCSFAGAAFVSWCIPFQRCEELRTSEV